MKLIVISATDKVEKEYELVNALFEQGLESFHLRKPGYTIAEMQDFLKAINPKFLRSISIHSNYELIGKYNLAGIHLTGDFLRSVPADTLKDLYKSCKKRNLAISGSAHTLKELNDLPLQYDYVFLSPVFDSISKKGYAGSLDHAGITDSLKNLKGSKNHTEVIALGGVDQTKATQLAAMNFDGAAILGAIWKEFAESGNVSRALEIYNLIKIECQTADQLY